jgi:hypothetical protein
MAKNTHSTTGVGSLSRRSFLKAGKLAAEPWAVFCSRLRRACAGALVALDPWQGHARAQLVVEQSADIHHALALCRDYGVMLAIDAPGSSAASHGGPVLWVRPGSGLMQCRPLGNGSNAWFVQPGCSAPALADRGFTQFSAASANDTVAQYLMAQPASSWPRGQTARSGLVYASVVLSDGTRAGLGPFGQKNTKPLEGMRLQHLVSSLFQLLAGPLGQACSATMQWPARYRLDALAPQPGSDLNLSHFVLGQIGELFWVDWLVIQPMACGMEPGPDLDQVPAAPLARLAESLGPHVSANAGAAELDAAAALDAAVKQLFDPQGVLPSASHPERLLP